MYTGHRFVDGMLTGTISTLQAIQRGLEIVHQRLVVQVLQALAIQVFECFQLLDIAQAHEWCQIKVEGRNSLSAVHLVLSALQRDTSQYAGRLDTLGSTRGTMSGSKTVLQDVVQWVLHASKTLGRIVILIVNVQIVMLNGVATLLAQQIVVYEWLGSLAGKLHHHARRCIGVHVGVFARHIVILNVHDIQEHLACLGLTGNRALVTISNVLLSHVLTTRLHQFHLHQVLNLLYRHLTLATLGNTVGNLVQQSLVLAFVSM